MRTHELAIAFGPFTEGALARAAALIDALPHLSRGLLAECDLGSGPAGTFLLVLARFHCDAFPSDVQQRLEFWADQCAGRVTPLAEDGSAVPATEQCLLAACEQTIGAVAPTALIDGVRAVVARSGGDEAALAGASARALAVDLERDLPGMSFDAASRALLVPSPLVLPLGDEVPVRFEHDGAARRVLACVVGHSAGGDDGPGSPAGVVLRLRDAPVEVAAMIASRVGAGRCRRRAPRYSVHVPAVVSPARPENGSAVRAAYADRQAFVADYCENLSQGGAFVRAARPLPVGSEVRLEIAPPGCAPVQLGGRVVHARRDGMGIEFHLTAGEERALSAAIAQAVRRGRRALVVDDNLLARRMLTDALRRSGFEVAEAPDAATALRVLEGAPGAVDVVIADLVMPGMSGEELLAAVRHAPERRPAVVVVSARLDARTSARLRAAGADLVVEKQAGPEGIRRGVDAVLARAAACHSPV